MPREDWDYFNQFEPSSYREVPKDKVQYMRIFGVDHVYVPREGVYHARSSDCDVLFTMNESEYEQFLQGTWIPLKPEPKMRSFLEIVSDMLKRISEMALLNGTGQPPFSQANETQYQTAKDRLYSLWVEMGRVFGKYTVLDELVVVRQNYESEKERADRLQKELEEALKRVKELDERWGHAVRAKNDTQDRLLVVRQNYESEKERADRLQKELEEERQSKLGHINKLITLRVQGNLSDMNSIKIIQTEMRDR